ncbi:MAG TPA: biotin--[acetyl-CoA-carboxylase] ligase [Mycobacteriales bacterium]|nr:biotin--[acetyl-CoA-carboxylase] ligase [Mycobacteriales bacterium]
MPGSQRPPLSESALRAELVRPGGCWTDLRVVAETASTNDDLVTAARAGAAEGVVLVAESQSAGRGRLDRTWLSPPRAGLTFSVLLRPTGVPVARLAWLPLLAGVSLCAAVRTTGGVEAALKWPNDLVRDGRKLAGVLSVVAAGAAVVGIGLNVSNRPEELPRADASSLDLERAARTERAGPAERSGRVDRDALLRAVLGRLAADYRAWREAGGDPVGSGLRAAYLDVCDTVRRSVSVALPSGEVLVGVATGVDAEGRLVVATAGGERTVAAGDVVHVR